MLSLAHHTADEAICPLCALAFSREDALCEHGCPLSGLCHLTRCPGCGYEFPERPKGSGRLRRLLAWRAQPRRALAPSTPSVRDMQTGARLRVLHLVGGGSRDALAAFGLVPGAELELLQRSPAFVIRVGETELALDGEVAARILIEPQPAP